MFSFLRIDGYLFKIHASFWLMDGFQESILLWQRKCEDALYSLLTLGARRPVRHLVSVAMARIISKGDSISIYSRVSSLQGFLSDGKRSEAQKVTGLWNVTKMSCYLISCAFCITTIENESRMKQDIVTVSVAVCLIPLLLCLIIVRCGTMLGRIVSSFREKNYFRFTWNN